MTVGILQWHGSKKGAFVNWRRSVVWALALLILGLVIGVAGGVAFQRATAGTVAPPADATAQFNLINEAWQTIRSNYVDQSAASPQSLAYGAIGGMADSLGDSGHTRFLTPDQVKAESDYEAGKLQGIGVEVQMKDGQVVVVAPLDGSPAQQAGVHAGDVILKVNGQDVTGLPLEQVVSRITGPPGTSVTITILQAATAETKDLTLVRKEITLQPVTWQELPGVDVAHIRISAFSSGTTDALKTALYAAMQQGAKGVILDLRDNPGGLLDEAVGVASQFLGSGEVLQEKDVTGQTTPVPIKLGGIAVKIPLAVLVNNGTGSASEVVAAALKDAKRGPTIGETTFGTGTVLSQFTLSDGSALLLATEEWLSPSGNSIWHKGITPDTTVTLPANGTPLVPEAEAGLSLSQIRSSGDAQLTAALDALAGVAAPAGAPAGSGQ